MTASTKKLLGSLILLASLVFYIVLGLLIGARLPHTIWIELPFYIIAGLGWIFPARWIIAWMHR